MIIHPSSNTKLIGYSNFFLNLKKLYDNDFLPNKIIFSGNNGIGKSTLAYHLINYIFSKNEDNKYDYKNNLILHDNRSYNLVLNNSHPNFFSISIDNEKKNIQISKVREMINFTRKDMVWLIGIVASLSVTWGMWSERLNAVERKADSVAKMQQDIAVIKEKILQMDDRVMWIEEFLIKTVDY